MAWTYYHEQLRDSHHFMVRMFELATLHGATVMASGDGSALYNPSGNVITGGFMSSNESAVMPGSFNNTQAWVRLRMPGGAGQPEAVFQNRNIANCNYIVWMSARGFTGGSPAAAVRPTAPDEGRILGSADTTGEAGVSESFGGGSGFFGFSLDAAFGDADEGYSWYCFMRRAHSPSIGGFFYDVVENPALNDPAPFIMSWCYGVHLLFENGPAGRAGGIPNAYPSPGNGYWWGYRPEGTGEYPRPYSFLWPNELDGGINPYDGGGYIIRKPAYYMTGQQLASNPEDVTGAFRKGNSRIWVGMGSRGLPDWARITAPESAVALYNGRLFLRWDNTDPRI